MNYSDSPLQRLRRKPTAPARSASSAATAGVADLRRRTPCARPSSLSTIHSSLAKRPHSSLFTSEAPSLFTSEAPSPPPLRQRWTFLDEPDCPVELKAMITHRISRYHEYAALYARLRDCQSPRECADTACALIEAYLDNRLATRELDYYQQHRRPLGRHPLWSQWRELSSLRSSTTAQLYRERQRTLDNIWRAESEMRRGTKPHLDAARRDRIARYRLRLAEIERLLAVDS